MTEDCNPPAAIGKSTNNVGNARQSGTQGGTGGGCSISFNPATWYGASAKVIAAENNQHKANNADRACHHAGGDDTDDELLLDDDGLKRPGLAGSSTTPPTSPGPSDQTQLSDALQGLSPTHQQAILKAVESLTKQVHTPLHTSTQSNGRSSMAIPAVDEKFLSSSIECSDDFFQDQGLELLPAIMKLQLAQIHVPLTLTMSSAIQKILNSPASLKMKKVIIITGQKLDLLDFSEWPEETSLLQEWFFEVWQNMLKLYAQISDEVMTNHL
ncbi:uncharacterized protein LAESUDRAFT_764045 [Laetiporus sulphureus 93-53]|uniref:Uncharacterized protein n=1 Tax=Laetiporus sulphureus 93-53 TaxID=1314785 RepID=A0A165BIH8_9APHY|nr:uncharacterized protein LAESUDRAFT_764045 [Laetiporus sulphureus 93-53]KZT01122.1 hypothetical protein LAESUDRAFT_764045 [Laetiporus sulphureus 93-53]